MKNIYFRLPKLHLGQKTGYWCCISTLLLVLFTLPVQLTAQTWEDVGAAPISNGGSSYNNLAIDVSGNYYISYYDAPIQKGSVQTFNGTSWSYVGASAGITTGIATFNSLALGTGGNVYYTNQGSGLEVRHFNGTVWTQLPSATTNGVNYQASAVSPAGTLFTFSNDGNGTVRRYVNGAWEQVGNTGFSGGAAYAEMAIASDNTVYTCNIAGGNAQVYKNSVTAGGSDNWTLLGNAVVGAASSSEQYTSDIALDANNNVYVAYVSNGSAGQKLNVKKFDGTSWQQVGIANFTAGKVQHVALAVTPSGDVYVAASRWENDNLLRNMVYKFDAANSIWATYGGEFISAGQATYNDVVIDTVNNYLVLVYTEGSVKVKRISIVNEQPQPVCNGTEPGLNTGDLGCVSFNYMGEQVSYATVRAADGNIWLQQNLGSETVADAMNDEASYGDQFQWGRWADGHQKRTSEVTGTVPTPNNPEGLSGGQETYIAPGWWEDDATTDTWTAATPAEATDTNGCDPCKALGEGWQLPTQADWTLLKNSENINNPAQAYESSLRLPANGYRSNTDGTYTYVGARGYYWSSGTATTGGRFFYIGTTIANPSSGAPRGQGAAIRCVKLANAIYSVVVTTANNVQPVISTANGTLQLVATVTPATANQQITWQVISGSEYASVNEYGLVTGIANGTVVIRATSLQDTTKFGEISVTVSLPQPEYCEAYLVNGCSDYMHIESVTTAGGATNIANTNSGCSNSFADRPGYGDFTAHSVTAAQGSEVSFTLNFTTTSLGSAYLTAWIDWNHDFTFSQDERIYVSDENTAESNTLTFTVSVPADAAIGTTRIRLKAVNGWLGSGEPCGYNSFGEIEDYTFNITEPVAVTSVTITTQNDVEAEITSQNGTLQLVATVNPEGANQQVNWTVVSGDNILVSADGLVTGLANGTATIRATSVEDETVYGEIEVTVNYAIPAQNVTVTVADDRDAQINGINSTLQLEAEVNPAEANQEVVWTIVTGSEFATIDEDGIVSPVANGTVIVRATSADDETVYGEIEIVVYVIDAEGYCVVTTDWDVEPITSVEFSGISNATSAEVNGTPAYEDFTAMVANVSRGESYTISVKGNTVGLEHDIRVFIDWNQDSTFDMDTEYYVTSLPESDGNDDVTATIDITVPATALAGYARMRVTKDMWNVYEEGEFDACTNAYYGQVEDYTVNVQSTAGVGEHNKTIATVYPNPTSDIVTVSSVTGAQEIKVYNKLGQLVAVSQNSDTVQLQHVAEGLYIMEIQFKDGSTAVQKIMKK